MILLQTSLIWVVYAVVVVVLFAVASVFIYVYQSPRDRSPSVTLTCIVAITSLLATILLLPVDVALVSSTVSSSVGQRKDWATPEVVDRITFSLTLVYYILYSLDILLCLLVVPFVYFWYEEYDEVAAQTGEQSSGQRFWGASKYTLSFIAILIILFLVGVFVPISRANGGNGLDPFKSLLGENREDPHIETRSQVSANCWFAGGERALTFALGLLITIGMYVYALHTSTGLAVLPIRLIKGGPRLSNAGSWNATFTVQLDSNRERRRQLEGRCGGNFDHLSSKDRRELDALIREERTLIRRQRLAQEADGKGNALLPRMWFRLEAFFRPFRRLVGLILLLLVLLIWVSMILTASDKAKNSICKRHCGYVLGHINIFNPINEIFVQSAKLFPIDYAIFTMLVLLLFFGTVVGIATVGIRFLWISIFRIRLGHTSPQALLVMTAILMLSILALNYSISMIVAPQYATFGPQTFCDRLSGSSVLPELQCVVKRCSEAFGSDAAKKVCTPSVASTVLNRVTVSFPFFGAIFFWSQFAFIGVYLLALITSLLRSPKLDEQQLDEDAEEAEEEALLSGSRRNMDDRWQSIVGRASRSEDT
ncbi:putative LMBR1 domain protein [Aspergillus nidulans FGSC A4]|uniref:putative LMBR1 domain protein n=1 Tax=Emericella nidulans (strain FGSC A4 / ATCC 38163 / CBS 112.46 / NRRL 194 / M139) TaxID=227321 RepID=UPI0001B785C3|nr:hypothetical protein [Aspergillus nidulans FGSC A4]CBF84806.1 TPA: Probable lysosomal cobalamin transporter [Source:UniProtKB/Swiss-Prot;Acc:Q5BDG8] [Aspergillus nidulans FGSC A4]